MMHRVCISALYMMCRRTTDNQNTFLFCKAAPDRNPELLLFSRPVAVPTDANLHRAALFPLRGIMFGDIFEQPDNFVSFVPYPVRSVFHLFTLFYDRFAAVGLWYLSAIYIRYGQIIPFCHPMSPTVTNSPLLSVSITRYYCLTNP